MRGSPDVFAEGINIGRVGDPTCTAVAQGSQDVFANGGGGGGFLKKERHVEAVDYNHDSKQRINNTCKQHT